jgi:hypothetical protein
MCEMALTAARESGLSKRTPSVPGAEAERRRPARKRPAPADPKPKAAKPLTVSVPRTKIAPKPPAALNRATRGVILANEARMMRLNAITKKEPPIDDSIAIFRLFPPTRDAAVVLVSEERDRLAAVREQAQETLSLALAQCIRALAQIQHRSRSYRLFEQEVGMRAVVVNAFCIVVNCVFRKRLDFGAVSRRYGARQRDHRERPT